MNVFMSYIRDFTRNVHAGLLIFCFAYAGFLIFINYRFGIEPRVLYNFSNRFYRFSGFYLLYLAAFATPYLFLVVVKGKQVPEWRLLLVMVVICPAVFALKVTLAGLPQFVQHHMPGTWGRFVAVILNLPLRLLLMLVPLFFIWWLGNYPRPFFGVSFTNFNWTPYLVMLLIMLPLVTWASTQADFLNTYPKLRQVDFLSAHTRNHWFYIMLFEVSYGLDFFTIELFFRGFLVLAFVRFAGQDAILPAAVFYCSIHFGKPLAECISSFFGGLLLGIIVYQTRSIAGGLAVHLGIAWMMEAGGYLGNLARHK
jgi:hypothetical protein